MSRLIEETLRHCTLGHAPVNRGTSASPIHHQAQWKEKDLQENIVEGANLRTDLFADGGDIALQVGVGGRRRVHQERELDGAVRNHLGLRLQVRHNGFQCRIFFPGHTHQSHIPSSIDSCFHDGVDVLQRLVQRLSQLFHDFDFNGDRRVHPKTTTITQSFKSDATYSSGNDKLALVLRASRCSRRDWCVHLTLRLDLSTALWTQI